MPNNDDDEFTLIMLAIGSLGAIIAFGATMAATAWQETVTWLLEHHVLVTAARSPWLTLPHADGAGLDPQRCFIAAGLLIFLGFVTVEALRRHWARGRELA